MNPQTTRHRFRLLLLVGAHALFMAVPALAQYDSSYFIVDTGQQQCYNNSGPITAPSAGLSFYGQDAQHQGNQPTYIDNGNGTVSDPVTGLMWVKARGTKVSWEKAMADAAACSAGGYWDWRVPTIKELYSLIDFHGRSGLTAATSIPYLNTTHFGFAYGDTSLGERIIDCQDWSATEYVHFTFNGDSTVFGVNFADGRIKGYPKKRLPAGTRNQLYVRYVRGNPYYGVNSFTDNHDSTVTDRATGLMWAQPDSRGGMDWEDALAWVQAKNTSNYLGHSDWRLPNAKELQSIVDYTRSPSTTSSAAIDPLFVASGIGNGEYAFYWTSTSHLEGAPNTPGGSMAVYLCFGRGLGWMPQPPASSNYVLLDVHGAGAQRSDPKSGNPANWPYGNGPQGDVIRILNHVRLVRGGNLYVPVELSSFGARQIGGTLGVRLQWTTQSETNNFGFFVQRKDASADSWVELPGGFVVGGGSSTAARSYAFDDLVPGAGTWQYRLRQVDIDGSTEYSPVAEALVRLGAAASPAAPVLAVYPNPVVGGGTISVGLELDAERNVVLRITDVSGRELMRVGEGMLSRGAHLFQADITRLPPGVYYCTVSGSSTVTGVPFVRLR